jgi:hypothetical protein
MLPETTAPDKSRPRPRRRQHRRPVMLTPAWRVRASLALLGAMLRQAVERDRR